MEVMIINELRLNFMEPAAQETLGKHMREFLFPGSTDLGTVGIGKNPDPRP